MRAIQKNQQPNALAEYLKIQTPVGVGLNYDSFTRKRELRQELIVEQQGLCAFTGAAIDDRLGKIMPAGNVVSATGEKLAIKVHNAHIKPRSVCRAEMIGRGQEPGRVVGEDMDFHNIVAALLVEGTKDEMFGGAAQGNCLLPVKPTDPNCENRFHFFDDGEIEGRDADAINTISILKLDRRTLCGWRQSAIEVFIDPAKIFTVADLNAIIAAMDSPREGKLPEYCFAIKQVALQMLPRNI